MTKLNGNPVYIHEVEIVDGERRAIVNKGEIKTPYVFSVPAKNIEGLTFA